MRLIYADAVEKITWQEPSYTDPLNVLTEVREKVRALPTINAIPVDWLIKWAAEHTEYGTITVEKIIEDWENDKTNRKERNF